MNHSSPNVDDPNLRSPRYTEHVVIDALEGIRIVREGESNFDSSLNLIAAKGSVSVDPNALQNHRMHRKQLIAIGSNPNQRPLLTEKPEPSLAKFVVIKLRSWLAVGYTRIISLHSSHFTTLDPDTFDITNKWRYRHIRSLTPCVEDVNTMLIEVVTEKGHTQLKLKCLPNDRKEIISKIFELSYYEDSTFILRSNRTSAYANSFDQHTFFKECERQTKSKTRLPISILCTGHGLILLEYDSLRPVKTYYYKDILYVNFLIDDSNGMIIHMGSNIPIVCKILFVTSSRKGGIGRSDLITVMKEKFAAMGISLVMKESSTLEDYHNHRYVYASKNVLGDTIRTFRVIKRSESRKNMGSLGDDLFVETYLHLLENGSLVESDHHRPLESSMDENVETSVSRFFNLSELRSIIRNREIDPERPTYEPVCLQFFNGYSRFYLLKNRDSLLASFYDRLEKFPLHEIDLGSYRLSSNSSYITEKICLKRLHQICYAANLYIQVSNVSSIDDNDVIDPLDECLLVVDACYYFIANYVSSSVRAVYDEPKLVVATLESLWAIVSRLIFNFSVVGSSDRPIDVMLVPILQTMYLLLSTSTSYCYNMGTSEEIAALIKQLFHMINDPVAAFWFLNIVSIYALPCEASYDVYKYVVLDSILHNLIDFVDTKHIHELPVTVGSSIIESLLNSHRLSTNINHLIILTRCLSSRLIMKLLQSRSRVVLENALILLWATCIYYEEPAKVIRDFILSSGLLLRHFYFALFCPLGSQRFFSRLLCSFFFSGPDDYHGRIFLKHLVPTGFFSFLSLPPLGRVEEDELDKLEEEEFVPLASFPLELTDFVSGVDIQRLHTKLAYLNKNQGYYNQTSESGTKCVNYFYHNNLRILFHTMRFDHELPDLIWNKETRNELRISLETELVNFNSQDEPKIVWNFHDFSISYPSLLTNVKVGSIYLRVFLDAGNAVAKSVSNPKFVFDAIFRRFIFAWIDGDRESVTLCIGCMNRLYCLHSVTIGPVPEYVVVMLRLLSTAKSPNPNLALWSFLATCMFLDVEEEERKAYSEIINENTSQLCNASSFSIICEAIALAAVNLVLFQKIWYLAHVDQYYPVGTSQSLQSPLSALASDNTTGTLSTVLISSENTKSSPLLLPDLRILVADKGFCDNLLVSIGFIGKSNEIYFLGQWDSLSSVWELRITQQSADVDVTKIKEISHSALKILSSLMASQGSLDENGNLFTPIPLAKMLMNGIQEQISTSIRPTIDVGLHYVPMQPRCFLPIIFQCILCDEAKIIHEAVGILRLFLEYNKYGCRRFYETGLFHILLMSLEHIHRLSPHSLAMTSDILSYVSISIDLAENSFDGGLFRNCMTVMKEFQNYIYSGQGESRHSLIVECLNT